MWPAKTLAMKEKREGLVREIALSNEAATTALGAAIAAGLRPGDVIALEGDLGSGKTTLARAILHALGVRELVPSPTFTLLQHYDAAKMSVDHVDLYRLESDMEFDQLGINDVLDHGAVLIEWPEKAGGRLPLDCLHVHIEVESGGSRRAHIIGPERWASSFPE